MMNNKSNFILILWAIILMVVLSLFPFVFIGKNNQVNHIGIMFLLWSMSASFVKGVGFIPKNIIARVLLSTSASVISAIVAVIILFNLSNFL